eukprot:TRINITY_DN11892_c0_g1_i1.p1 TRINITY_DN11892_c0_g1~~TRINITY_DN11892_c0_g1_i1.p1  ORF type:complete len:322 (-),score=26.64 TRINITY_DN11892_c0_g1_i1:53-1018(-)
MMEYCFAVLRWTGARSTASSKQSRTLPPPKEKVRATGLCGEGSPLSKPLTSDFDITCLTSGPQQDRKGSSTGLQKSERISCFGFCLGKASSLMVSLSALDDDGKYDDGHKTGEGSSSRSYSSSWCASSENDSSGSETPCSDSQVTLFRRWTDSKSPAAHDGVSMIKVEKQSSCVMDYVSNSEARRQAFDPVVVWLATYPCQRRITRTRTHAEEASGFTVYGVANLVTKDEDMETSVIRDHGSPRAESPKCTYHLKPQLESVEMQVQAPVAVANFSHRRMRAVRVQFPQAHVTLAEPSLETVEIPAPVKKFSHQRTRTSHFR